MRIGHGFDVHALVEGRPLILGGVNIPWSRGLLGHSDADVLLHALCDALLGAAALGDIARARGMTQLARDTGLSRESLYKSLSGERAPSTDTLFKVMKALGFELKVQLAKDGA